MNYSEHPENFNLKNSLLDAVPIHNRNIHTITNYKPIELMHNTNKDIYDEVMENIQKSFPKIKND